MKPTIQTFLIALIILLLNIGANGQSKLVKARAYKNNYEYAKAIPLYLEYFKKKTPKYSDVKDIATCYMMTNDLNSAQEWLSKYNTFTVYSPKEMLNYAYVLKVSGDYEEAMRQYIKFSQIFPEKAEKLPEWLIACVDAKKWIKNPENYEVTNVKELNSEYSDYGLIPYKNGFLFSSDRKQKNKTYSSDEIFGWTGSPYLKIYNVSNIITNSMFTSPSIAKEINGNFHNGSGVYDYQNDVLYFTVTREKKKKSLPINSDPTDWEAGETAEHYVNRMEIYSARLVNDKWEDIQPFKYNNSDYYSIGHPAISPDGNILYFASNMPGGYGSSDIYYCLRLTDGSWGTPHNAGYMINTEGKEAFPVIDSKGTLFFSSDGHQGVGGLDIFEVHGSKDNWDVPENMRVPINSPQDDFSPFFIKSGLYGYLSSNREGGAGEDDIYYFHRGLVVKGQTYARLDDNSIEPLNDVDVIITNLSNDDISTLLSDNSGTFIENVDCGVKYEFKANKKGYFSQDVKVIETKCDNNDTIYVDLVLDQIIEFKSYVLNNIYYDFDKWNIRPDAAKILDKLVAILLENPEIDIELGSHTDSRGTEIYNQKLSQKRAESAVEYIISRGIDSNRLSAKGYGELQPAIDCKFCTEEEHQINRRTEFTVTKIRSDDMSFLEK